MYITFSNKLIDNILCKIDNLKEDWARFTWHRKHHNVRCQICDEVLDSNKTYWGPKDCGWGQIRGTKMWICHQCLCHRDFKPYIEQKRKENLEKYGK